MKHPHPTSAILLAIALTLTAIGACRKSNSPTNVLPPATEVGLNTMGCLIDGELFIPQEPALATHTYASARVGSIAVWLSWNDEPGSCGESQIDIHLDSIATLQAGMTFQLGTPPHNIYNDSIDAQWASYTRDPCQGPQTVYSTSTLGATGTVAITHYDPMVGILSGTFSFDAVDPAGDTVHVRQGRFDMQTR